MQSCMLCGSNDAELIAAEVREGPARICRCKKCDLIFQDMDMTPEQLKEYYNSEYEATNSLKTGVTLSAREHFDARMNSVAPFMVELKPYLQKDMKVLDVGCGAGEILHSIKPFVKEVVGVELNKSYIDFAQKELGIRGYAQDLTEVDFKGEKFDFIICLNSLDHMAEPFKVISKMRDLLSPKGFMYLMMPNRDEALNVYLPEPNRSKYYKFFLHKAHLFYFNEKTFRQFLDKAGLTCENLRSFHQYSLKNFLQWYFVGKPQLSSDEARLQKGLFLGNSPFETQMNKLFEDMDHQFKKIITGTYRGDIYSCISRRK